MRLWKPGSREDERNSNLAPAQPARIPESTIHTGLQGRETFIRPVSSHSLCPSGRSTCHSQAKPESISFHFTCSAPTRLRESRTVAPHSAATERERERERESCAAASGCVPPRSRLASRRRAKQEIEDSRYQQLICQKVKGGRREEGKAHATPV